jgi:hypothetical protein
MTRDRWDDEYEEDHRRLPRRDDDRRWDDRDDYDDRSHRDEYDDRPPMPKNYLTESILVVLFCCMPFGIAAIVNAASVQGYWYGGNYRAARRASDQARMWCWVAFGIGFVLNIVLIVAQVALEDQNRR